MDTNKKKLLLVMPPQKGLLNGFAAGLISLVNYVDARMPEVRAEILDLSAYSFERSELELERYLADFKHEIPFVGITTTTASYQSALKIASYTKRAAPHAVVVFGGHHSSADPENVLSCHPNIVDVIVVGEGERSLYDLLRCYPILENVPGLAFLAADGSYSLTDVPTALTQDELDSIPITYGRSGVVGTPGKFDHITYVSARGCPLRCAFCAVSNHRIRCKSVTAVIRDIEALVDLGFTRIAIEDNFFAHSRARTREVCEALSVIKNKGRRNFSWDCQTRVESLARTGIIELMADAGCDAVYIGVESVHSEQLIYLNKTNNPSRYLQTLTEKVIPALLDADIECYLNLQFGLPGETEDHERTTCSILSELGALAGSSQKQITIFPQLHVVYPGTTHFQQGIAQNRFPKDIFETFTKWEFQQAPVLYWLGEHFAHGTGGIPEGILNPAVLRSGDFQHFDDVVDTKAIFRISATLRQINRIRGVRTFNYGDYLVADPVSTGVASPHKMITVS
jgi:radical SAM superfamily enzyme YgiQ (UPF0313 family)